MTELRCSEEQSTSQLLQLQSSLKQLEQGMSLRQRAGIICGEFKKPKSSNYLSFFPGKRETAERLNRTQASLSLQEELTLRMEEEKRSLEEQLSMLRASHQATESKTRGLQVGFLVIASLEIVLFYFSHIYFVFSPVKTWLTKSKSILAKIIVFAQF